MSWKESGTIKLDYEDLVQELNQFEQKAQSLQDLANQWGIPMSKTVAVGDGANDAMMLENAAVGIAYCAKPSLKRIADYCIEEPDLRQVLTCLSHSKLL